MKPEIFSTYQCHRRALIQYIYFNYSTYRHRRTNTMMCKVRQEHKKKEFDLPIMHPGVIFYKTKTTSNMVSCAATFFVFSLFLCFRGLFMFCLICCICAVRILRKVACIPRRNWGLWSAVGRGTRQHFFIFKNTNWTCSCGQTSPWVPQSVTGKDQDVFRNLQRWRWVRIYAGNMLTPDHNHETLLKSIHKCEKNVRTYIAQGEEGRACPLDWSGCFLKLFRATQRHPGSLQAIS